MPRLRTAIARAAALHRQAAAVAAASERALEEHSPEPTHMAHQHELAERLRAVAANLAPGWLGAPLSATAKSTPLGGHDMPPFVRVGLAQPLDDARFPVVVPLLTRGHLAIDADARDPRVAGLLRSLVLRLLAAAPAGTLRVRAVDAAGDGMLFARFAPLARTNLMPPPVADRAGLQAVLTEAEQWVRLASSGRAQRDRLLLLVIASLPELADGHDLARIAALARAGPQTNLHLVAAGWPPPPLTSDTAQDPLPMATAITVRNPYAVVGPPSGSTFGSTEDDGVLNSPVFLDEDPPPELVDQISRELAAQAEAAARLRISDLVPDEPQWGEGGAGIELATTVGLAAETPVVLRFNELTAHWMVGGRAGSGKTAFLLNVLFGLAMRYPPQDLSLYLLSFKEGVSFAELTGAQPDPTWLPHARGVGVESDREYGLAVLRELAGELDWRAAAYERAGVTKFADAWAAGVRLPRVLCVIDEFHVLFGGTDATGTQAIELLDSLARRGKSYGIHLVLASQSARAVEALYDKRDSIFGQFPVRIALPGGGDVLDPTNESAVGLPLGAAVVNTAGGFGGPRGAVRGHETTVHFPDPHVEPDTLTELRRRLWQARPDGNRPPYVFAGYARPRLAGDPAYRELAPGDRPTVLIGQRLDVALSTAAYPLNGSPGRHLAVLGPSGLAVDVLDAAARSVAAQHRAGTARFLLAPLAPDTAEPAARLAKSLSRQGHPVTVLDRDGVPGVLDGLATGDGPATYLIVYGADGTTLPTEALRAVLREGPAHGHHVFGWWRGLRRFTEDVGEAARGGIAGLVLLNLPSAEVPDLLGRSVDWRPRPERALLYDRDADRASVLIPFAREGEEP